MEWLFYLLKVSACTGLFYLFYFYFLRKLTFFGMNRRYLLITLILSFTIPGLEFKVEVLADKASNVVSAANRIDKVTGIALPVEPIGAGQEEFSPHQFDWSAILNTTYMIVALGMLLFFIYQIAMLLRYTRNVYARVGELRIVYKPHGFTNCSFMNYVFVDDEDLSSPEINMLIQHESIHASHYHSVDKLFAAFCKIVLWFNPFIYLYEQELEQLHEYEADQGTSKIVGSSTYAELLLVRATERTHFSLVHNFSRNPLKERIKMLFHHKSKEMKKLIYCASVPLLATLLWGFSVEYVSPSAEIMSVQKDSAVYRQRIKRNPEMIKGKQVFEEWRKTDDYKLKVLAMERVSGKTLTGVVKSNIVTKNSTLPISDPMRYSVSFVTDDVTYALSLMGVDPITVDLLQPNTLVTVKVSSANAGKETDYIELHPEALIVNGKEIYRMKPSVVAPFLYEVNRVRFAKGIVKKVNKTGIDTREFEILANGYEFLLKINNKQVSLNELTDVKIGDNVTFRFVHELKTGTKAYLVHDWVSISEDIRSYGIKNKLMFAKFYEQVSSKKVVPSKTFTGKVDYHQDFGDRLHYSAKDSTVVNQDQSTVTLYGSATLKYNQFNITADQIVFNTKKQTAVARNASFYGARTSSKTGVSDSIHFDIRAKKLLLYGIK